MKKLTEEECIEICEFIYPEIIWEYFDDITWEEGSPYHAIDGFLSLDVEAKSIAIYYENNEIIITDKTSKNMKEKRLDLQKILDQVFPKNIIDKSSSSDEIKRMIFNKYVKKITDRFSTTVEYRMKESVVLYNNEGLAYGDKIDLNLRVFVENDDFLNSKIVLALTYYAPEPGTGTILHESVADVMLDNKDVFKLDNEYSYSGLDYYGAQGNRLEICDETLADESSRIEQIQFYIDLTTLIKIVNAKTFEIRFNKKWGYGGIIAEYKLLNIIGFYNALFDNNFKKEESLKNNKFPESEILEYWKQGKQLEALKFYKDYSGTDFLNAKIYVENLCELNGLYIRKEFKTSMNSASESIVWKTYKTKKEKGNRDQKINEPKKNEEVERQKNINKLMWYFIIYLGIAFIIWLVKNY
jgi:hypothetical protein